MMMGGKPGRIEFAAEVVDSPVVTVEINHARTIVLHITGTLAPQEERGHRISDHGIVPVVAAVTQDELAD